MIETKHTPGPMEPDEAKAWIALQHAAECLLDELYRNEIDSAAIKRMRRALDMTWATSLTLRESKDAFAKTEGGAK